MNKKCPHYKDCKNENEKLDPVWRYDCPDKPYRECLTYEEFENVQIDKRTAGEHQE